MVCIKEPTLASARCAEIGTNTHNTVHSQLSEMISLWHQTSNSMGPEWSDSAPTERMTETCDQSGVLFGCSLWVFHHSLWLFSAYTVFFKSSLQSDSSFLNASTVSIIFYAEKIRKVSHFVRRECAEPKWRSDEVEDDTDVWRVSRSESAESHEFCIDKCFIIEQ